MSNNKMSIGMDELLAIINSVNKPAVVNTVVDKYRNNAREMQQSLRNMVNKFSEEEKVDVTVAVPYGEQCGGYLKIGINGSVVEIPCDGKTYKLPKTLAEEVKRRLSVYDVLLSDGGYQINPIAASNEFLKAGLKSAGVNEQISGELIKKVSYN